MISADSTQTMHNDFDKGPLSWVMTEIREALTRSKAALHDAVGQTAEKQSTMLKHAKTYLHQAHGALQMVEVDGVVMLTEAIESLFDRMAEGKLSIEISHTEPIEQALGAIQEYLEALLAGGQQQAVSLFSYYRTLQIMNGAERIHPADLFYLNLTPKSGVELVDSLVTPVATMATKLNYSTIRHQFEKALLLFLKKQDDASLQENTKHMQKLIAEIWHAQRDPHAIAFWAVMHGFAELVSDQRIYGEQYVKQLFGRINLQIRRLVEGVMTLPEQVMRDALFYIARTPKLSPNAARISNAFHLQGRLPVDYEKPHFGKIEFSALNGSKERVAQIKNLWGKIAAGDTSLFDKFEQQMKELADVGIRLNSPPLSKLLREMTGITRHAVQGKPQEEFSLAMATSLLFIESALDQVTHLPADFSERAAIVTARLLTLASGGTPLENAPWLDEMSREVQQRQTISALISEMQVSLRLVEKTLDDYFRSPEDASHLHQIDPVMHQIGGALLMLDHDEANRALIYTQELIRNMAENRSEMDADKSNKVAQNIGALSFYIEALQTQPESIKKKFSFDKATGCFKSHLLDEVDISTPIEGGNALDLLPPSGAGPGSGLNHLDADDIPVSFDNGVGVTAPELTPLADTKMSTAGTFVISAPVVPVGDDEVDAELLDVFLMEAEEVLDCINDTIPLSRHDPVNQDHLVTLRRSFHTLKGSGRMVGLGSFGAAAWSIEQVMNFWLADSRSGTNALYALLEKAHQLMLQWVIELQKTGRSSITGTALIAAADRVREDGVFDYDADSDAYTDAAPVAIAPALISEPHIAPELDDVDDVKKSRANQDKSRGHSVEPVAELVEESAVEAEAEAVIGNQQHEMSLDALKPVTETSADVDDTKERPRQTNVIEFPSASDQLRNGEDNIKYIGELGINVPLYNIYLAETDEIVRYLVGDFSEWRHEPHRHVSVHAVHAIHSLSGSSATVGFVSLQEVAHALEMVLQRLERYPVMLSTSQFDTMESCLVVIKQMLQLFAVGEMAAHQPDQILVLEQLLAAITERVQSTTTTASSAPETGKVTLKTVIQESKSAEVSSSVKSTPLPAEDLDADLLPIFIEEGRDLFPQLGETLRAWQDAPGDMEIGKSIFRILHTLKGSARMAGAMILGQHTHDMETEVEDIIRAGVLLVADFESLMTRYDHAVALFGHLENPHLAVEVPIANSNSRELATSDSTHSAHTDSGVVSTLTPQTTAAPATGVALPGVALLRVRAEVLDRLVNQAGEVSISRSRLENEVETLRSSLLELTENVTRMRHQLREVEIQAESQMSSRTALSGEREFDPLEFDRFTRLQELTRMMAETVNDVSTVQTTILRTVEGAGNNLQAQARLTRELQQDLMRVRMVPFSSVSERLYRVTRQVAKELDKRVTLDIRGGSIDMDRSVLEKMVAPFEHLLRNAIVHGIETREQRRKSGKSETGEIRLEVRQEGNEVVIHFNDDGRGLDLDRIKEKAKKVGLIQLDQTIGDAEAIDLIFQSGFSTVQEVTELAGRGVGMDVVRAEAATLGGRVAVTSISGVGASFTIHLPLTLAVTQVVLLKTGENTYAVPSVLVEQVQQVKAPVLAQAYNQGAIFWQGHRVPMYYLSTVLADYEAAPKAQQYTPIIIMKTGVDRVALHVDEVIGNREVVVKNIGPQLSRMIGISGATVLGSGDIVLILDPLPLALKASQDVQRAPRMITSGNEPANMAIVDADLGAIHEIDATPGSLRPAQQLVQGLRRQSIVMVVDDSLTVRKVTQRLLSREGYQVMLAKDGVDALEQLQAFTPDVMLVDIEMPRMDGFDLTRNVRNGERTRDIPIIMITSRTADKHRNYAHELGVNAYFGKPYQEEDLLNAIAGFCVNVPV